MLTQSFLIERPEWQNFKQRTLYGFISLVFWAIWIYLWLPLFKFLAWLTGMRTVYLQVRSNYISLINLFSIYLSIIALLGGTLVLWALYNYLRFRGLDRRHARPEINAEKMAAAFSVDPTALAAWKQSKRAIVHHDANGQIIQVECSSLSEKSSARAASVHPLPAPKPSSQAGQKNARPALSGRAR